MPSLHLEDLTPAERANVLARLAKPCRRGHNRSEYYYLYREKCGRYVGIHCRDCLNMRYLRKLKTGRRNIKHPLDIADRVQGAADAGLSYRQTAARLDIPIGTVVTIAIRNDIHFHGRNGRPPHDSAHHR